MINVTLDLYIFVYSQKDYQYYLVSTDKDSLRVPSLELSSDHNIKTAVKDLFEKHVALSSQFVTFKTSDPEIVEDTLHIVYYSLSPFSAQPKPDSFLLPSFQYAAINQNIQQIINIL